MFSKSASTIMKGRPESQGFAQIKNCLDRAKLHNLKMLAHDILNMSQFNCLQLFLN